VQVKRSDNRIVYDGDFSNGSTLGDIPLPVSTTACDFTVTAWIDGNQNGVWDSGEDKRTVEVIDPSLDVLTMTNVNGVNTPGGTFQGDKLGDGIWVPSNTDNDGYNFKENTNTPISDLVSLSRGNTISQEDDLLPIVIHLDANETLGEYRVSARDKHH
jgi:hypothetical protein